MSTIILTGATGYVGSRLNSALQAAGHTVVARSWRNPWTAYNDLNRDLDEIHPDVVINAAGYVGKPNVDACENDKETCYRANVLYPMMLCLVCRDHGVSFGHVSSGCIYSDGPHGEADKPNFTGSWYSYTKAEGEAHLAKVFHDKLWIWRLRMPFNSDFTTRPARNLLAKLDAYDQIIDGVNSITYLPDFVRAVAAFVERGLPYGTWNLVNPEPISNARIVELMGGKARTILAHDSDEAKKLMLAPRSFCVLKTDKAQAFNLGFMHTEDAILDALAKR